MRAEGDVRLECEGFAEGFEGEEALEITSGIGGNQHADERAGYQSLPKINVIGQFDSPDRDLFR